MPDERVWSQYDHIAVKSLRIGDIEVDPATMSGKIQPIAPLKSTADTADTAKKVNEIIAALKVAGIMENK